LKSKARGNVGKKLDANAAALKILSASDLFSHLRGALLGLGLAGWEIPLGLGVHFAAVSRFQPYPLRVQIQQQTEGTAEYILRSITPLFPPRDVIIIDPAEEKAWEQFAQSPNDKVVYIPQLDMRTDAGTIHFDVQGDRIVREIPERKNGRIVNQTQEVKGRFVCISTDRPDWQLRRSRWLTMAQQERQAAPASGMGLPNFEEWREVDRLLREGAKRRIWLPDWAQIVVEQMFERDDKALRHVPALMQMWRTMCLIRSFQRAATGTGKSPVASFEDLAAAILLAKKVFREGHWFPSAKQIFEALPTRSGRTGVISPVTGKAIRYERQREPTRWQSVLP
jgi:hypothetical protein